MPGFRRFFLSLTLFASLLAACTATPLPDPPVLEPTPVEGVIHIRQMMGSAELPGIEIPPGVLPPDSILWVANLDDASPPLRLPVESDGSVTTTLFNVVEGNILRLQLRQGDLRSTPVDGRVVARDQPLATVEPVLGDCLSIEPATEIDFGDPMLDTEIPVVIENNCTARVQITPALREGRPQFMVLGGVINVPVGEAAELTVRFTAQAESVLREDIALLEVSGPDTGRRAISLLGR